MPQISIKGLAKYMTATPAQQRRVLRQYKYPAPEGQAMAAYYRDARNGIFEFYQNGRDMPRLRDNVNDLRGQAQAATGARRTRLQNNARALGQYGRYFADRNFTILERISLGLNISGVTVTVNPDLHVTERNRSKIIKLDFTRDEPDTATIRIISQAMFQAQIEAGMGLTSASVLYLDVPRGQEHRGARAGSRMLGEIEAACQTIEAVWDGI